MWAWPGTAQIFGYPLLSRERVKLRTSNFVGTFTGSVRTKAAISLKRVKIEEKLVWTAYRNQPPLFRTVPSPTPYGLPFLEIGGLQLSYPLLSQERVKLRTSNLASTFKWPIRIKAHKKFWRKREVGVSSGCPNFLGTPYYLRNG